MVAQTKKAYIIYCVKHVGAGFVRRYMNPPPPHHHTHAHIYTRAFVIPSTRHCGRSHFNQTIDNTESQTASGN